MSTNFFDQSDDEEFRDQPEEVSGKTPAELLQQLTPSAPMPRRAPLPPAAQLKQQEEEIQYDEAEFEDILVEEDEDDYSAVLSDARLRLEQGRLYEMIMNHDLFEGMDSDPAAVKHVQRQIRKFAKEQMEIMLGMRKETSKVERLEIDFPFNAVEVQVLKMVASKASGGKSENSDRYVPEVTRTTEEVETVQAPKKMSLSPIVGKKPLPKQPVQTKAPVKQAAPVQQSALRKQAAKPVTRKPLSKDEAAILAEEQVSIEELNSTFEPDFKPIAKPLHEMSAEELLKRNQETSQRRHKTVKNPNAMPMPTFEQEQMMHLTRVTETTGKSNAVALIMNAINNQNKT